MRSFTGGSFLKQKVSKNYQKKHQKIVIRGAIYLFFYLSCALRLFIVATKIQEIIPLDNSFRQK